MKKVANRFNVFCVLNMRNWDASLRGLLLNLGHIPQSVFFTFSVSSIFTFLNFAVGVILLTVPGSAHFEISKY